MGYLGSFLQYFHLRTCLGKVSFFNGAAFGQKKKKGLCHKKGKKKKVGIEIMTSWTGLAGSNVLKFISFFITLSFSSRKKEPMFVLSICKIMEARIIN